MKQGSADSLEAQEPGFTFLSFRLEFDGALLRGNTSIHLPPKELSALRLLLANAGKMVTPLQLRKALWGDVHVTEDSIPRCISSLRTKLQPDECIQTVYKRGYRFTAPVRRHLAVPQGTLLRLAIMPFATALNVPEHLGLAIAEETIARLSGQQRALVLVLARDSTFALAQRGLTAHQVGVALHSDLVLTGNPRVQPSHYRLRVEMIRVADGAQICVEDLLVAKVRIAGLESELVDLLASRFGDGSISIAASAEPTSEDEHDLARHEAYEMFQHGRHESQTLQRRRMDDGLQHLLRATELDPALIPAQIDLANVCITQAFFGFMAPQVAADLVRRTAESIPTTAVGAEGILPALGWIRFHADHDLTGALDAFARSAHLPHDSWTTRARVMLSLRRHRFSEAIDLLSAALHEDQFSPWLNARLAWAYHLAEESARSHDQIERTLGLFPEHECASLYAAVILAWSGEAKRATRLAEELTKPSPFFDIATAVHGYALACAGHRDEAHATLERLQWLSRERYVLSSFTPAVYVALGDLEGAITELRGAEEARCRWFFQMLADPRLQPLRVHPDFVRMQETLNAMEAHAASSLAGVR